MAGATTLLVFLFVIPAAYATTYMVGGTSGWALGVNYTNWAAGETFHVGDSLMFIYGNTHTVDEVSSSDYNSCSSSNTISTAVSGNTSIALSAMGSRYFICGTTGHCPGGMKLEVTVSAATGPTSSPSTPGSTSPPPPPPPPRSNGVFFRVNTFLLGAPIVMAALLAVMG
ncbi:mavicyanin-like [Tasmannia lanceolata]|uniref:mavicyanin-like n=1 Tax=Tasmannia lanceolata TaxID=3420 RepID=UPI00406397FC